MGYTNLLTIAMPVYERKEFFLEALESAINQTVKCEIIVVDNCSSHDYFERICKQKGITYYRNDTNIGMYANCNRCFELAKTEYVMTLDDDDKLSPIYVESFLKAKELYPDLDVYFTNFVRFSSYGKLPHPHTLPFGYMGNGEKVIEYAIRYKLGFPVNSSSIKRSKFNGFYTKFKGSNDWLWIYTNADKFVFFGDSRILFEFREHANQDTRNNVVDYLITLAYINDMILKEKTVDPRLKQKALSNAFWALFKSKSLIEKGAVNKFLKEDNIFSNYLKNKLNSDWMMKIMFSSPRGIINFMYKLLRKFGITG